MCGAPRCVEARRQQALAAAQNVASGSLGYSASSPFVFGEEDDSAAVRVTIVKPIGHLKALQRAYVTGSGVQSALKDGRIVAIGAREAVGRLWQVGGSKYHDKGIAERVAAQTGQIAVEIA